MPTRCRFSDWPKPQRRQERVDARGAGAGAHDRRPDAPAASSFAAGAEALDFIVRVDDPRRHVVACAGAPICASATSQRAPLPRRSPRPPRQSRRRVHKSTFRAAPKAARIRHRPRFIGTSSGCALIAAGATRDAPFKIVATSELPAAVGKSGRPKARGRSCLERAAYLRDGTAIYQRSFAIIRAEADLSRFGRRGRGRGAHDSRLRAGRGGGAHRVRRRRRLSGAASAGRRRADLLRCRDGGRTALPAPGFRRATM